MHFFRLFAHGDEFDVDAYYDRIGFDRIWHTGERHYTTSGIEKILGDGERLAVCDQERIAVDFLEGHEMARTEFVATSDEDKFRE